MLQRLISQRRTIGGLAALGLIVGAVLLMWDRQQQGGLGGNLFRAGMVLATLWLAIPPRWDPDAKRLSAWQGLTILLGIMVLVNRPWLVIPLLVILGFLNLFTRRRT